MNTNTKRPAILKAAQRILQRDGVAHLTMDAVARESGVSKGGVLYHFPSKEALLEGIVSFLMEDFTRDRAILQQQEEPGPGQWVRSYIRASTIPAPDEETDTAIGLIVAITNNPQLLAPIRAYFAAWQEEAIHDGLPPALATILRLAADGLWFSEWLGLAPPQGTLREEVIQSLLSMARSSAAGATR
jgi:AcrR family transcriptional regulator